MNSIESHFKDFMKNHIDQPVEERCDQSHYGCIVTGTDNRLDLRRLGTNTIVCSMLDLTGVTVLGIEKTLYDGWDSLLMFGGAGNGSIPMPTLEAFNFMITSIGYMPIESVDRDVLVITWDSSSKEPRKFNVIRAWGYRRFVVHETSDGNDIVRITITNPNDVIIPKPYRI